MYSIGRIYSNLFTNFWIFRWFNSILHSVFLYEPYTKKEERKKGRKEEAGEG